MTDALGPIDYVVLEFPGNHFNGGIVPALLDLVDTGLVRVLDLAFVTKDEDGNVAALELRTFQRTTHRRSLTSRTSWSTSSPRRT